jgi:hypothetical protein
MLKKDRFFIRIPADRETGKKPAEIRTSMWGKNLHKSGTQGEPIIQKLPHWRESILAKTRTSRWGKNLQISGSRCGEKICTKVRNDIRSSGRGKNLHKSGTRGEPIIQKVPHSCESILAKTRMSRWGKNLQKSWNLRTGKNLPIFEARWVEKTCQNPDLEVDPGFKNDHIGVRSTQQKPGAGSVEETCQKSELEGWKKPAKNCRKIVANGFPFGNLWS